MTSTTPPATATTTTTTTTTTTSTTTTSTATTAATDPAEWDTLMDQFFADLEATAPPKPAAALSSSSTTSASTTTGTLGTAAGTVTSPFDSEEDVGQLLARLRPQRQASFHHGDAAEKGDDGDYGDDSYDPDHPLERTLENAASEMALATDREHRALRSLIAATTKVELSAALRALTEGVGSVGVGGVGGVDHSPTASPSSPSSPNPTAVQVHPRLLATAIAQCRRLDCVGMAYALLHRLRRGAPRRAAASGVSASASASASSSATSPSSTPTTPTPPPPPPPTSMMVDYVRRFDTSVYNEWLFLEWERVRDPRRIQQLWRQMRHDGIPTNQFTRALLDMVQQSQNLNQSHSHSHSHHDDHRDHEDNHDDLNHSQNHSQKLEHDDQPTARASGSG